jgi:hypothetical protein
MSRSPVLADAIEPWEFLAGRALGRVVLGAVLFGTLGAVVGALSTTLAFVAFAIGDHLVGEPTAVQSLLDVVFFVPVTLVIGALLGGACAPVAGWLFLRRVPLWRAAFEPAAAVVGAAALCGPLGMPYALPCAFGAFWVAAARLGWSHRGGTNARLPGRHSSGGVRA